VLWNRAQEPPLGSPGLTHDALGGAVAAAEHDLLNPASTEGIV